MLFESLLFNALNVPLNFFARWNLSLCVPFLAVGRFELESE